jgi:hypothetical protein
MNDKKATAVEKHYERRWIEAKAEMLKDAGPVVDFFISMHEQCSAVATKHNVNSEKLTSWLLEQLPIEELCAPNDEEDEGEDEGEEEEYEE